MMPPASDRPGRAGKLLLVSGVPVERTPVLGAFIDCAQALGHRAKLLEYRGGRLRYAVASLLAALVQPRGSLLVFTGLQSLPALVVASRLMPQSQLCYWALESYVPGDAASLAVRLSRLEDFVAHRRVNLILPIEERAARHRRHAYARVSVLPNVPRSGRRFVPRTLRRGETVRLVHYGSMDPAKTYIDELIDRVAAVDNLELTTIGTYDGTRPAHDRVRHLGPMRHADLLAALGSGFHYAVVGYKPLNFNWTFCAPNKFYESLSCSLPVVANSLNPTLRRLVGETGAGICGTFDDLSWLNADLLCNDYAARNGAAHAAYCATFNFETALAASGLSLCQSAASR